MNREKFIAGFEATLEMSPGSLHEDQKIRDLEHWDSLKLLEILVLADEQFDIHMDEDRLAKCVTVGDVLKLMESTAGNSLKN